MHWYVNRDEHGDMLSLIETPVQSAKSGTEISEAEYKALMAQIAQLAQYVDQVASGAMELADVPEQYREQVAREIAAIGPEEPAQMTETETALTQMGVQVYE